MAHKPVLYIVIPCYNEESVLPITSGMFRDKVRQLADAGKISDESRILFVNDGSKDKTWEIITALSAKDPCFQGIAQSRNRGHQRAVWAGLMEAKDRCDITISIDCDGQDDINAMDAMVDAYLDGCEIVYGVRSKRDTDTFFKRFTAEGFYKLLSAMGAEVVFNHADYRLISSRALQELAKFREVNLYLRGMVPLVGFKSTSVSYERHERIAGESHYPLKKMLGLAFDGITSLSVKPIRMVFFAGLFITILSFIGIIWAVIAAIAGHSVAGWASLACLVCFVGGMQCLFLGIIGEYIGKIYWKSSSVRGILFRNAQRRWVRRRSNRTPTNRIFDKIQVTWVCVRRSPEGDRKALWSPPQRRTPCRDKDNHRSTNSTTIKGKRRTQNTCSTKAKSGLEQVNTPSACCRRWQTAMVSLPGRPARAKPSPSRCWQRDFRTWACPCSSRISRAISPGWCSPAHTATISPIA